MESKSGFIQQIKNYVAEERSLNLRAKQIQRKQYKSISFYFFFIPYMILSSCLIILIKNGTLEEIRSQFHIYFTGIILFLALHLKRSRRDNVLSIIQREQIEIQNKIIQEKQQEIIDSLKYAKRIQRALMANDVYIARNLKGL